MWGTGTGLEFILTLLVVSLTAKNVFAQATQPTSLYIPGFDPQPVSAEVAGVDEKGRTTWLLHKGSAVPGSTARAEFVGTATLVEGAHNLSFTYANSAAQFSIGQECTFSDQFAVCTIVAQQSTATQTEFVSRIEIQGGGTVSVVTPGSTSLTTLPETISPSLTSVTPGSTTPSTIPPTTSPSQLPETSSSLGRFGFTTPFVRYLYIHATLLFIVLVLLL